MNLRQLNSFKMKDKKMAKYLFTLFLTLITFSASIKAQDSTFQLNRAFQIIPEDDYEILDLITRDFGADGVHEIICELSNGDCHKMGFYRRDNCAFQSDSLEHPFHQLFTSDFDQDREIDIVFGINNYIPGRHYQGIYVYYGPDFNERYSYFEEYYFERPMLICCDRFLDDGTKIPVVFLSDTSQYHWDYEFRERRYHEIYTKASFWQGTWEHEYPRNIWTTALPKSFTTKHTNDGAVNDFFLAGWNNYVFDIQNRDLEVHRNEYYYQLFTTYGRRYIRPDSLTINMIDVGQDDVDPFHLFHFSKSSCVLDLDGDGRLEWVQPHWERDPDTDVFTVHLAIYYPDSLAFAREYVEELDDIYYIEEIEPSPIRGVAPVDIDNNGVYELLFAVQRRPIRIIDSQTMEVIMTSETSIPDMADDIFQIGHFDNSGRLQILIRNVSDIAAFNLPQNWSAPYLKLDPDALITKSFILNPAYPNPFNATTTLSYTLPRRMDVELSVWDATGRKISVLDRGRRGGGEYRLHWRAEGLSSGVYFIKLKSGGREDIRKVSLVR